jgi:large subunit ribosomal protein L7/L12
MEVAGVESVMSLTNEQVVDALGNMTVMQLCELTRELEDKWGVKAVPQVSTVPGVPLPPETKVEEQTEFTVVLHPVAADKKMAAIKVVREITGLGLKEAKEGVEKGNMTLKENVAKAEAEEIKAKFVAAGCEVTVK